MGIAERFLGWTTAVVGITAATVGGGALMWTHLHNGVPFGLVATLAFGVIAALAIAQVAARGIVGRPEREVDALIRQIDGLASRPDARIETDSSDTAEIARAVNRLVDRVRVDVDALRSEALAGHSAMDVSPNGVLVVASDGLIRYVNPAFQRLVEVRPGAVGRPPIEAIPLTEIQQAVEAALAHRPIEELHCRSGRLDLTVRAAPIEGGGAMVLLQDVTRFRMIEKARTEFVANVSHELRTPIATIMGYAETLSDERERLTPDVVSMADAIHRHARRLRDLFEDLLELSRIEARSRELPLRREVLLPILETAVTGAADLASQRKQQFDLECGEQLQAMVNVEALTTIIANLATNATNYTPEGGHIEVVARSIGNEVVVEVKDDGIGIDRAHHERIFERFYRVDEGRSRRVGGTGLGLAIVKHLALASGCRVAMQSAVGKGTTFEVHLPTVAPARPVSGP